MVICKNAKNVLIASTMMAFACAQDSAYAQLPFSTFGNLGYFFSRNQTDHGAKTDSQQVTGSLSMSSYLWRPWFANLDAGGTVSSTNTTNDLRSSDANLVSTHLNLGVLPRSRYPFLLSYTSSDSVLDWHDSNQTFFINADQDYRTQSLTARQAYITRGGNRIEGWYNWHNKGTGSYGEMRDNTYGAKFKGRASWDNLYVDYVKQEQTHSLTSDKSKNSNFSVMNNLFPTSEFYNKTLYNRIGVTNETNLTNGSFVQQSTTDVNQLTNFFYWRPVHKPYIFSGGFRYHKREVDFSTLNTQVRSLSMNGGLNYQINRKTRFIANGAWTYLDYRDNDLIADETNSSNVKASASLTFHSDQHIMSGLPVEGTDVRLFRGFLWNWYGDITLGGNAPFNYDEFKLLGESAVYDESGGVGHNLTKSWITGNRSTLRWGFSQAVREYYLIRTRVSSLNLNHTTTLTWSNNIRSGSEYAQLTLMDNRDPKEDAVTQLANLQVSRNSTINRLSSFTASMSVQSSRTDTKERPQQDFLSTTAGRLTYQHSRLFGIYKLQFRTRGAVSATNNRKGGDRRQTDLEGRLAYQVGKLNTSLVLRKIWSGTGVGSALGVFQVNRNF